LKSLIESIVLTRKDNASRQREERNTRNTDKKKGFIGDSLDSNHDTKTEEVQCDFNFKKDAMKRKWAINSHKKKSIRAQRENSSLAIGGISHGRRCQRKEGRETKITPFKNRKRQEGRAAPQTPARKAALLGRKADRIISVTIKKEEKDRKLHEGLILKN